MIAVNRRWILVAVVLLVWPAAHPELSASANEHEVIARDGDVAVSMNSQRRRRSRPKRRGGKYEVVQVAGAGAIEGVVTFRGPIPEPETIRVVKDHETCDRREKSRPLIRADIKGNVADAVVFLGDIKSGKAIPQTEGKPTITQRQCTFEPHVQVLQAGQPFDVVNGDPVAHNAQCVQHMKTLFNPLQPTQGLRNEFSIRRPGLATITCAVHNWMKAYAYVLWHPYYAVTGDGGAFAMTEVPPGEYELVVWQEHLGERTRKVMVTPGNTTTVAFELAAE